MVTMIALTKTQPKKKRKKKLAKDFNNNTVTSNIAKLSHNILGVFVNKSIKE